MTETSVWRSKSVTAGDVTLWTESLGSSSGQPLLLIMGAMNQGLFWPNELCKLLTDAGFLVIRYDHRDTGRSSKVNFEKHPYTVSELADDALAILDAYDADSAVIVGMSMGGYVAQVIAARHPDRVDGLVLLSTTADHRPYMESTMGGDARSYALPPPSAGYLTYVESARSYVPSSRESEIDFMVAGWRLTHAGSCEFPEADIRAMIGLAAARESGESTVFHHALAVAASPPRTEMLSAIRAPTLVLHGAGDPCLPLPHGRALAAGIANARLVVLDMGHMLPPCLSVTVAREIVSFLSESGRTVRTRAPRVSD